MSSFLPPIGRSSQPYGQLPLPPGSALRFSADDLSADEQRLSNSNALMQNLETEMGRLLSQLNDALTALERYEGCLLYTSPSPRD